MQDWLGHADISNTVIYATLTSKTRYAKSPPAFYEDAEVVKPTTCIARTHVKPGKLDVKKSKGLPADT